MNKIEWIYHYYNDVRIRHAEHFLLGGSSIKEAAEAAGYNNLNYFYKIFKAKYGMTPKEYLGQVKDGELV